MSTMLSITRPTSAPCGTIKVPGLWFPALRNSAKWAGIEFFVVRNDDTALSRSLAQNFWIGDSVESGRKRALEVD